MTNDLVGKVRKMLWEQWDPIGVNQCSEAKDEYDNYVLMLCEAVASCGTEDELFQLLWSIETRYMGLDGDEHSTRLFAKSLANVACQFPYISK